MGGVLVCALAGLLVWACNGRLSAKSQKTVRHRICIKPWAGVDVLTLGLNIPEFMQ
jgi:hypothetical protein